MTIIGFLDLIRTIYSKREPNLEEIEKKGLLAVKIAQHFALRIDFLDESVCRHLMKLYGHASFNSREVSQGLIEKTVPQNWLGNFSKFDYTPFTAASVGQVHNATLGSGEDVVVKIIKADFLENFLKDIKRLDKFFSFVLFFYPKLERVFDPKGVLQYIAQYTKSELDLRDEIRGQNTLKKIYDDNRDVYDLSNLKFHKIHGNISGEKYLVSEEIDGDTLDNLIEKKLVDYSTLLELFKIHGFYLFGIGTFHGDIHPGNIMIDRDKNFYFIDTSAISEVSERLRKGLFYFFVELSHFRFEEAALRLEDMSEKRLSEKARGEFIKKFLFIYKDFAESTVSEVSLTKKMMETIKLGVNSGMDFGKGMFSVIKSLMYLDGMVLRVNPSAKLLKDMRPFIKMFEAVVKK